MTSRQPFDLHGHCQMVHGFSMGFCTKRGYLPYLWFEGSLNLEVKLTGMPISFSRCIWWHCGVRCLGRHTVSCQSHHGWQWRLKNLYVGTHRFVLKEYVASEVVTAWNCKPWYVQFLVWYCAYYRGKHPILSHDIEQNHAHCCLDMWPHSIHSSDTCNWVNPILVILSLVWVSICCSDMVCHFC